MLPPKAVSKRIAQCERHIAPHGERLRMLRQRVANKALPPDPQSLLRIRGKKVECICYQVGGHR